MLLQSNKFRERTLPQPQGASRGGGGGRERGAAAWASLLALNLCLNINKAFLNSLRSTCTACHISTSANGKGRERCVCGGRLPTGSEGAGLVCPGGASSFSAAHWLRIIKAQGVISGHAIESKITSFR